MHKSFEGLYRFLGKLYKSQNPFLHFLAYITFDIIGLPLYWITQGGKQISSLSGLIEEMRRQGRKVTCMTRIDILFEFFFHGYLAYEYLAYHFEDKSFKERKAFYSEMDRWRFSNICNNRSDIWKLRNKRTAYELFKDWYKREQIIVKSADDLETYKDFASRHSVFFAKPFAGGGGIGARWIDVNKYSSVEESFNDLIKDGSFVIEEGVYQCKEMAAFNPDSINTIRMITMRSNGKVKVWHVLIRTGRKGSIVDNGETGGLLVLVDPETGKLISDGANKKGQYFPKHPDSNIPFIGFQVPMWKELCDMAIEMMELMPSMSYIGWDFAVTDNGPVVIEANGQTGLCGPQLTRKRGLRKEFEEDLKTTTRADI